MASRNWPHPVLDAETGDYPNCAFQASFEVAQTRTAYSVTTFFQLGCDTLEEEVRRARAEYAIQVACPRTAYRAIFRTQDEELRFSIPEHELRDTFTLSPFVVARKPIKLSSKEFAATFAGLTFDIRPGAILAIAPPTEYVAEKTFDELRNLSAIFEVTRQADATAEAVEYDLNGQKIAIVLPQKVYDQYRLFRRRPPYREMFASSLVLPGLAEALSALQADDGDGELDDSQRWRRAIRRRLRELNRLTYTKDETFKLAQELLEWPFLRTFRAIETAESDER